MGIQRGGPLTASGWGHTAGPAILSRSPGQSMSAEHQVLRSPVWRGAILTYGMRRARTIRYTGTERPFSAKASK
jgi:hypothetical protein